MRLPCAAGFKKLREYVKDVMNVMPVWEDNERVATAVQVIPGSCMLCIAAA